MLLRVRQPRVRGRWLIGIPLVVSGRRILWGVMLWVILVVGLTMLTVVLRVVLAIVLLIVLAVLVWVGLVVILLRGVTLLWFLSIVSERHPGEAPLRWWRVLIRITLLLRGMDEGHVGPCNPSSPVSEDYCRYDHETGRRNGNTCANAQPGPANPVTGAIVVTMVISHYGRRQIG